MKKENGYLSGLQDFLYENIPLTKAMALQPESITDSKITIKAPLANNINDKGSVFGGSSSALMIISAWSLIKILCDSHKIDADIVIHENICKWHKPLYDELTIEAELDDSYDFEQVRDKIENNRHFRINCDIKLLDNQREIYSTMTARYVIIPKK